MVDRAPELLTLVRSAAAQLGDAPWFGIGDAVLTARELSAQVEAFALGLLATGCQPGERIAILLPRSFDEAIVLLGTAAAGGIAVPVHARLKEEQIAHVLQDCAPFAVVTDPLRLLALGDAAAVLGNQRVITRDPGALPVPATPWPQANGDAVLSLPRSEAAAVLLYSSGSTGRAKGIVQNHRNLALGAAIVAGYLGLTPADHVLALLPFSFDYGLNQLLAALHVGCRITAADHLAIGEVGELLRSRRPTGLAGVPSLWHEVAQALHNGSLSPADGASLRYITNSGGSLRRSDSQVLRAQWPHVQVFAMYGLTEAFRSAFLPPAEFDAHPESFGRALPGVELLLVSPETGEVLQGAATGELVHAGALVALGYWQRPQDSQARFRPDPRTGTGTVVYSGDLVRRDAEGRHFFVSRMDRLLKVQGHRVSPDEVAAAITGTPGVGEVAVFGVDGQADGHHIVACVGGDPGDADLCARIERRCRARLPSWMRPARLHVLTALPHNQNGKVDEAALRAHHSRCTERT